MNRLPSWLFLLALVIGIGACGAFQQREYYAATVCIDRDGYRVPDSYCPVGDGISNAGFQWAYDEYDDRDDDVQVVYVGYPVDRTRFVTVRPPRVATVNLDRGRFPEQPATAVDAGKTSADVATIAAKRRQQGSSTVTRGGLGVRNADRAEAPLPNRNLDSPAPGRDDKQTAKRRDPPPPPKTRAVAPAKTSKTTKTR